LCMLMSNQHHRPPIFMQTTKPSKPARLKISNFAHLKNLDLTFGDLTVLVGPQGAGKSLALQWLKVAMDGRQIVDSLRAAGHPTDRPEVLIDLIFGTGMAAAWDKEKTHVSLSGKSISPKGLGRLGNGTEKLFFVPAHRSMLISDGWAAPFQKLGSDVPAVARMFSQNLNDRFNGKDAGTLFPVDKRLKKEIREKIDQAIFHGGTIGIEEDMSHARRLRLVHGDMHLPFMTWTAGQREFTPMMLGLYHLLPSTQLRKREETDWVVLEEPEMGLHPQAVTAVMLLVLDLLWRGYRVVLSTHSPHVLTMVWMIQRFKANNARWQLLCEAFDVPTTPAMKAVATGVLGMEFKTHMLHFDEAGQVESLNISDLDPGAEDDRVSGWGGLTEYSSRFGAAVRQAVLEQG
ncbi:MAG TPA: AAA family ATPase, partial [Limnobacter sp.]|nr:AAA family ATPase [Limnobacter sp.]